MRLSPGLRRGLQVLSAVLLLAGAMLAIGGFVTFASGGARGPSMDGPGPGFLSFMAGIIVLAIGGGLARLAFLKPVSELVATETGTALEYGAQRVGRGLAAGLEGGGGIRVRCRSCGFLDSEDARFCSGCGQAI